jgi:hypothetical protein
MPLAAHPPPLTARLLPTSWIASPTGDPNLRLTNLEHSPFLPPVPVDTGGLAKFATPIEWWGCEPLSNQQNGWKVDKFTTSKAKVDPWSTYDNAFTVEWQQW